MHDALNIFLESEISSVSTWNFLDYGNLCQKATDLYWYISSSAQKLESCSFFNMLTNINDKNRSKHKVKSIWKETLLDFSTKMNILQEKYFNYLLSFAKKPAVMEHNKKYVQK